MVGAPHLCQHDEFTVGLRPRRGHGGTSAGLVSGVGIVHPVGIWLRTRVDDIVADIAQ